MPFPPILKCRHQFQLFHKLLHIIRLRIYPKELLKEYTIGSVDYVSIM
jgi:hypothetical protein